MTLVAQGAVFSVAWLSIASGFEKQRRPSRSVEMWRRISAEHISESTARSATIALGMIELAIGLLALISPGPLTALWLAACLGALAIGAALTVATNGSHAVPCGCFGERGGTLSWSHVALNTILSAVCIAAVVLGDLERSAALSAAATIALAVAAIPCAGGWWWRYAQAGSSPYNATAHSE